LSSGRARHSALGDGEMRGREAGMGHGPSRNKVPVTSGSARRLQTRACGRTGRAGA
jgi:hypothetical protein